MAVPQAKKKTYDNPTIVADDSACKVTVRIHGRFSIIFDGYFTAIVKKEPAKKSFKLPEFSKRYFLSKCLRHKFSCLISFLQSINSRRRPRRCQKESP